MNLVKCSKGHFYDGDKFSECPHCKGANSAAETDMTMPADMTVSKDAADITEALTEPLTVNGNSKIMHAASKTQPMFGGNVTEPLDNNEKTIGFYFEEMEIEPVVGWLVGVEGKAFGKSFNLKSGKNFIGRNFRGNDVVLENDNSVSREKHAIIVFDPKSGKFLAQPGMSSELFYVNDEVILQATLLKTRDVIQIGKTKLMFVPFCGPDFSWDDFKKDEEKEKDK